MIFLKLSIECPKNTYFECSNLTILTIILIELNLLSTLLIASLWRRQFCFQDVLAISQQMKHLFICKNYKLQYLLLIVDDFHILHLLWWLVFLFQHIMNKILMYVFEMVVYDILTFSWPKLYLALVSQKRFGTIFALSFSWPDFPNASRMQGFF